MQLQKLYLNKFCQILYDPTLEWLIAFVAVAVVGWLEFFVILV